MIKMGFVTHTFQEINKNKEDYIYCESCSELNYKPITTIHQITIQLDGTKVIVYRCFMCTNAILYDHRFMSAERVIKLKTLQIKEDLLLCEEAVETIKLAVGRVSDNQYVTD